MWNGSYRRKRLLGMVKAFLFVLRLECFARKRNRTQGAKAIALELPVFRSVLCCGCVLVEKGIRFIPVRIFVCIYYRQRDCILEKTKAPRSVAPADSL